MKSIVISILLVALGWHILPAQVTGSMQRLNLVMQLDSTIRQLESSISFRNLDGTNLSEEDYQVNYQLFNSLFTENAKLSKSMFALAYAKGPKQSNNRTLQALERFKVQVKRIYFKDYMTDSTANVMAILKVSAKQREGEVVVDVDGYEYEVQILFLRDLEQWKISNMDTFMLDFSQVTDPRVNKFRSNKSEKKNELNVFLPLGLSVGMANLDDQKLDGVSSLLQRKSGFSYGLGLGYYRHLGKRFALGAELSTLFFGQEYQVASLAQRRSMDETGNALKDIDNDTYGNIIIAENIEEKLRMSLIEISIQARYQFPLLRDGRGAFANLSDENKPVLLGLVFSGGPSLGMVFQQSNTYNALLSYERRYDDLNLTLFDINPHQSSSLRTLGISSDNVLSGNDASKQKPVRVGLILGAYAQYVLNSQISLNAGFRCNLGISNIANRGESNYTISELTDSENKAYSPVVGAFETLRLSQLALQVGLSFKL